MEEQRQRKNSTFRTLVMFGGCKDGMIHDDCEKRRGVTRLQLSEDSRNGVVSIIQKRAQ